MTLSELNLALEGRAESELARCCGSMRWARVMAEKRPYASIDVLIAAAERVWWSLDTADWLEAFAGHPRIGERATSGWSADEQKDAALAPEATRRRLAQRNQEYERKFGYTFLISATGKSAEDILVKLEHRLAHEPADELQIAAAEQRKITELRLMKLVTS